MTMKESRSGKGGNSVAGANGRTLFQVRAGDRWRTRLTVIEKREKKGIGSRCWAKKNIKKTHSELMKKEHRRSWTIKS